MDLDARPYRSFVAIAETASFSRAAILLHISQPALSAQIREFERRLGFMLFVRTSRSVALTPEGRLFLDRARRLVQETDWANATAREIRSNQLRIGAAHYTAAIPERNALIDDFMMAAPDVPLRVLRRSPIQLRDDLSSGDIDVAILLEFDPFEAGVAVSPEAGNVQRWVVGRRRVRLWVPPGHADAGRGWIDPLALRGLEVGVIDRSHGVPLAERVNRALEDAGAIPVTLPEGDAQAVARQCWRQGKCAIDLGWFPRSETDMVSIEIRGWSLGVALVVHANPVSRRDGANRFIAHVINSRMFSRSDGALVVRH